MNLYVIGNPNIFPGLCFLAWLFVSVSALFKNFSSCDSQAKRLPSSLAELCAHSVHSAIPARIMSTGLSKKDAQALVAKLQDNIPHTTPMNASRVRDCLGLLEQVHGHLDNYNM